MELLEVDEYKCDCCTHDTKNWRLEGVELLLRNFYGVEVRGPRLEPGLELELSIRKANRHQQSIAASTVEYTYTFLG